MPQGKIYILGMGIVFMLLTLANGRKTKKRLKEKKKAQAVQTKYLNEAWLQRKNSYHLHLRITFLE